MFKSVKIVGANEPNSKKCNTRSVHFKHFCIFCSKKDKKNSDFMHGAKIIGHYVRHFQNLLRIIYTRYGEFTPFPGNGD